MTTAAERARGIALWVAEGATQEEIIEALVNADTAARHWAVAQKVLPREEVGMIAQTQQQMLAGGAFDERVPHDGQP